MNNFNFNSLTNIKAPEKWIENALNIPSTVEKKKPLLFFKHGRAIAAVACLMLVSVVSITIYLTQDRIIPPIDPNYNETEASVLANATDISSVQDETFNTEQNEKPENTVVLPTQPYELIEPTESSSSSKPTQNSTEDSEKPTQGPIVGPTLPNDPPEQTEPATEEDIEPEAPSAPPAKPTMPPQPPAIDPSEPIWVTPTESPTEEEATDSPTLPNTPEASEPEVFDISFTGKVDLSLVSNDSLVFCKVYDSNNRLIGDANEYSSQHQAYILGYSGGKAILTYSLPDGLITQHGTYTYYFYNRYGEILYSNTKTL